MPNDWFKFTGKKEGQPSQDCVRVLGSLSSRVSSVSPITHSLGRLLRRQMRGHLLLIPPQELGCMGLDRQPRKAEHRLVPPESLRLLCRCRGLHTLVWWKRSKAEEVDQLGRAVCRAVGSQSVQVTEVVGSMRGPGLGRPSEHRGGKQVDERLNIHDHRKLLKGKDSYFSVSVCDFGW